MKITLDLPCQKALFDLDDDITYLNCAYMSPQLKIVSEKGKIMLRQKMKPYYITVDDFFKPVEELKRNFSQLINNDEADRIAIIPAASYGIANAAHNAKLEEGQKVIVVGEQFPSNYYCWKNLADQVNAQVQIIGVSGGNKENWTQCILDEIDESTRVVSMGHVHWADGTLFDLKAIRQKTRQFNALLIIDGTQSIGALPFDVKDIDPDALICGGYKWLMGPYSLGLAYYGPYFDQGEPIEHNWINRLNSQDFKGLVNYQDTFKPMANRYSVGEQSNFILVPMLNAAIQQLIIWGPENIQNYCAKLWEEIKDELIALGIGMPPEDQRGNHLVGLKLGNQLNPQVLQQKLKENKVHVSLRGEAIRVSPHVYNTQEDMQRLLACFKASRR